MMKKCQFGRMCKIICHIMIFTVGIITHISASSNDRYILVHSINELSSGDEIIIVNGTWSQTMGAYSESTKKYDGCGISIDHETAIVTDNNTTAFVYEASGSNIYLKTKETNEYIGCYVKSSNVEKGIGKASSITSSNKKYFNCKLTFGNANSSAVTITISPTTRSKYYLSINNSNERYVWYFDNVSSSEDYAYCIYKKTSSAEIEKVNLNLDGKTSSAQNTSILLPYNGKTVNSITVSRAFAADGGWYTLCLPFSLTADEISNQFKGALFNKFTGVQLSENGTAHLQFQKVTETEAGIPYMVLPKETVENPTFTNKTLTSTAQTVTQSCLHTSTGTSLKYSFIGVFDPTLVSDSKVRFVGGDKGTELLIPDGEGTMKGLRAYFLFPDHSEGIITYSKLNVDDGTASAIINVSTATTDTGRCYYSITGIPVPVQKLKPGLYIKDGKKIVVK